MGFPTNPGTGATNPIKHVRLDPVRNITHPMHTIPKPRKRSKLRQTLGREYYIIKRHFDWKFGGKKWAKIDTDTFSGDVVFEHHSPILRKLQGVDMQLQHNKRTNLQLAISHLNQICIRRNETFSVWRNVGRPTKSKGYLEGLVLHQGKLATGTGGGLCQLGNLLFWIFAHSPLTITERFRHGFDVFPDVHRTVPFGAGASLSYNYIDLQVTNNTIYDFKIELWLDQKHLHGRLLCKGGLENKYRVVEKNHLIKQQFWGGYSRHNEIVRIETDPQGNETEHLLVKNDAIMMYNPLIEDKTP